MGFPEHFRCGKCRWFVRKFEEMGECRLDPPLNELRPTFGPIVRTVTFRATQDNFYCSHWKYFKKVD